MRLIYLLALSATLLLPASLAGQQARSTVEADTVQREITRARGMIRAAETQILKNPLTHPFELPIPILLKTTNIP